MARIAKHLSRPPKEAAEFLLLKVLKNNLVGLAYTHSSEKLTPSRYHCLKVIGQEVRTPPSVKNRDDKNEPQDKPGMDVLKKEQGQYLPSTSAGRTEAAFALHLVLLRKIQVLHF
ncbi:unnamed protein product, partial [Bubo scandiacus]